MSDKIYNEKGQELNVGGSGANADTLLVGTFNSSYNEIDVAAKREEFCGNIDGKEKIETFLFFTDPHLTPYNREYYEATNPMNDLIRDSYITALQKYYNSLPLDACVCGGDWINYLFNKPDACNWLGYCDAYMRKLFKNYYPVYGNHDNKCYKPQPSTATQGTNGLADYNNALSMTTVKNLMFRKDGSTYYSFDGTNTNTKFYVLDSGMSDIFKAMTTTAQYEHLFTNRWEQVDWLGQKLKDDDAETSVVFMHIYSNGVPNVDWFSTNANRGIWAMSENVKSLVVAYNKRQTITLNSISYNFTQCTGHVMFIMCGHSHADYVDCSGDIPIVAVTNLEGGYMSDTSHLYAKIPTFDCCMMDNDNNVLYLTRIGQGKNRIIHCVPVNVTNGSTANLTSLLSGSKTWAIQSYPSTYSSIVSVSNGTVTGLSVGYAGVMAYNNTTEEYWIVKVA